MAPDMPDMSAFLDPPTCANNNNEFMKCEKSARQSCGGCNLVQYCSRDCQLQNWSYHKKLCKSAFMKDIWVPDWYLRDRTPAFIGGAPFASFGTLKYLWGNMPALDVLALEKNEGTRDLTRDFHLLFAASGDLRNVVKTVVGIPSQHQGSCVVVLNDKEFDIVARNAVMLLVALYFDVYAAVPMIIHIWYSALLPKSMVKALQSCILPLITDVCDKIKGKQAGSLQAKTFDINNRKLRLVLKKEEWTHLAEYFQVPAGLTAAKADDIRRQVTLAPQRIDHRERAMLQWSPALRQVDTNYRDVGVLLPYGCSTAAFGTPNPTLFQGNTWPMKDGSSPRDGWNGSDYLWHAKSAGAKSDAHGALFFHLRDLLSTFCNRIKDIDVSFQMHYVNAQSLHEYVGDMQFDRIEISNICDRAFLGPHMCLSVFSGLLKPKSVNPHATLLMLFLNAAPEAERMIQKTQAEAYKTALEVAMRRLAKLLPIHPSTMANAKNACEMARTPEFVARSGCHSFFTNWDMYFDIFVDDAKLAEAAKVCGVKTKDKHTIVERWPARLGARATKEDLERRRASSLSGWERYMELSRA